MAKRVLVLSASVGAGHLRAAQAVELALRELDPSAVVKSMDVLGLTNAAFRRVYGKAYLDLVNKAPHVLGYFYDLLDRPPSSRRKSDRLRLTVEKLNLRPLLRFLRDEPWDIIVNTHFLPAEMIASLRRRGELTTPQFTATTDFETHRLWVNQPCDRYFTATDEGAVYLQHWGVPATATTVRDSDPPGLQPAHEPGRLPRAAEIDRRPAGSDSAGRGVWRRTDRSDLPRGAGNRSAAGDRGGRRAKRGSQEGT